jgi:hypothetical protein
MTRRRALFRLKRRYGKTSSHMRGSVTSMQYMGKIIILSWSSRDGYTSEVVGDGTVYPGPSRDAAIAKAKRAIDAMRGG